MAQRRHFDDDEIADFVRLSVHEHWTLREIATKYHTTPQSVRYHLRKRGLTREQRFLALAEARVHRRVCAAGCVLLVPRDEVDAIIPTRCPVHHQPWLEASDVCPSSR